jgi:peptidyl-tRNA hydrolase, PTH1 family
VYLIVGLGNPGKKYDATRHNVGFEAIDVLADRLSVKVSKIKFKALIGETVYKGQKVILAKPQTFMNLSGEAVHDMMRYYGIPVSNLIVIYDDFDTEIGKIRIRKSGSAGSHNGMKHIIYRLADESFPRIRIGIGRPGPGWIMADFVLSRFDKEQVPVVIEAVKSAADAALCIVDSGVDLAMNRHNVKG